MRRYRNRKTGAVIAVYGQVNGKNWEPLEEAPFPDPEDLKDPYEEIFGKDPAEAPPVKPKTARKGEK